MLRFEPPGSEVLDASDVDRLLSWRGDSLARFASLLVAAGVVGAALEVLLLRLRLCRTVGVAADCEREVQFAVAPHTAAWPPSIQSLRWHSWEQ
jgi:hypothetical protein